MAISRRKLIQVAGAGAAALALPKKTLAAKKTLRILQWNHFVPAYDKWFNGQYVKEWGEKNDTEVIVDNVGIPAINPTAAAEVSAKKGHDLFMFLWPRPAYEEDVIDHGEIYQECEKKFGKPIDLAIKSTYNPKTKKYFGFSDMFVPDPINYRLDLFQDVGGNVDSWDNIRKYGAEIKKKTGIPVGIGQAAEIDTAMAVRAILYAFGGGEQDEQGNIVLNSKQTLEAVKFVKALYQETMTPEVLSWDASSNNRAMLAGKASVVLNAISVTREGENKGKPAGKYSVLADAQQWAANVGFPGYANAAIDEIYSTWVLNTMFGQASTGAMSPEDAVKEADAKCRKIWQKWKERKLL